MPPCSCLLLAKLEASSPPVCDGIDVVALDRGPCHDTRFMSSLLLHDALLLAQDGRRTAAAGCVDTYLLLQSSSQACLC